MRILLSIKPEFANKIFSGEKKFEYRRSIFKSPSITTVVVYASSPVQKVIGEFEIAGILNDDIKALWDMTASHAGISKDFFTNYFSDKKQGFAIQIKNPKRYKTPKCIKKDFNALPPQSFLYLDQ